MLQWHSHLIASGWLYAQSLYMPYRILIVNNIAQRCQVSLIITLMLATSISVLPLIVLAAVPSGCYRQGFMYRTKVSG